MSLLLAITPPSPLLKNTYPKRQCFYQSMYCASSAVRTPVHPPKKKVKKKIFFLKCTDTTHTPIQVLDSFSESVWRNNRPVPKRK